MVCSGFAWSCSAERSNKMDMERIVVGPLQVNCYLIYDRESLEAIVVDPGDEPERIMKTITERKLKVKYIVCTHGHFDHIGAATAIKKKTGAKIAINKDDLEIYLRAKDQAFVWGIRIEVPEKPEIYLSEGDNVAFGGLKLSVLSTPGHSPGGICLNGEGIIFSGDTVFAGSVGRTDFYGGSIEELKKSFKRILSLPPDTKIFPGHGEETTVKHEKSYNFFAGEL